MKKKTTNKKQQLSNINNVKSKKINNNYINKNYKGTTSATTNTNKPKSLQGKTKFNLY